MDIQNLVGQLAVLAGFGALVALAVNVLKALNLVKDGQAPTWVAGLNLLLLAGLFALKVFKRGHGGDTRRCAGRGWWGRAIRWMPSRRSRKSSNDGTY